MLILAKDFEGGDYAEVQSHFEKHWTNIGAVRDMMMISSRLSAKTSRVFLLLPNNNSTPFYNDFHEVSEDDLPEEAALLVGYQDDFEQRFKFTTRF